MRFCELAPGTMFRSVGGRLLWVVSPDREAVALANGFEVTMRRWAADEALSPVEVVPWLSLHPGGLTADMPVGEHGAGGGTYGASPGEDSGRRGA